MKRITQFATLILTCLILPIALGAVAEKFGLWPSALAICLPLVLWTVLSIAHYRASGQHAKWSFTRFLLRLTAKRSS
ncbi:hypothetical protein VQ574_21005 (plasmid) [Stutzerimonas frequens]|uniref:hypothetical protein n=1 Tax=Stutzerimonas frequens TaxID=2968969 RepID=UPI002DB7DD6C|nr:hypothetical protein [Stutzerimonas frequens]WRW29418.1 hypothetical protein VQ574_21005 [Stutzerimonas frequens]